MRAAIAGMLLGAGAALAALNPVAASIPSPPGNPPPCCSVPPPAPTPVPTLAPTAAPVPQVVAVRLAPTHVKRGQKTTLAVQAPAHETVIAEARFRNGKSLTLQGKVGKSGTFKKVWRVPRDAAIGSATLRVTVRNGKRTMYRTAVTFEVTQ